MTGEGPGKGGERKVIPFESRAELDKKRYIAEHLDALVRGLALVLSGGGTVKPQGERREQLVAVKASLEEYRDSHLRDTPLKDQDLAYLYSNIQANMVGLTYYLSQEQMDELFGPDKIL